jgi:ABC-type Fe3+/spermidine/putrescine transport system ATPase subunit
VNCRPNPTRSVGDEVSICIRPEDVDVREVGGLAPSGDVNVFRALVTAVDFTGDKLDSTLTAQHQELRVRGHPRTSLSIGDERECVVPVAAVAAVPR